MVVAVDWRPGVKLVVPLLPLWIASPPRYVAFTLTAPNDCGVNEVVQLPLAVSEQLPEVGVTDPPAATKFTTPPGVEIVPGEVSVTVAVQVVACPTLTGWHATAVFVDRLLTTMVPGVIVELPLWEVSALDGT